MSEDLSFEEAQYDASPAASACRSCAQPLGDGWWEANALTFCAPCKQQIDDALTGPLGAVAHARGFGMGLGAALLGTAVWYGIRALTGYEIGLVAIAVGALVGYAVKTGAGRGGRLQQLFAVGLTYLAIVGSVLPDVFTDAPADPVEAALYALFMVPFLVVGLIPMMLMGGGFITVFIYGFGLFQAFQSTGPPSVGWSGPFGAAPRG